MAAARERGGSRTREQREAAADKRGDDPCRNLPTLNQTNSNILVYAPDVCP